MAKSELQKLIDGEWYRVDDSEVAARKLNSATRCQEFNAIPENEPEKQAAKVHEIFGSAGSGVKFTSCNFRVINAIPLAIYQFL